MFTTLPESRAPRTRRLGGTLVSVVAHGALIAGAVALTVTRHADATGAPPTPPITYIVRPAPPSPLPTSPRPAPGQPSAPGAPAPTIVAPTIVMPGVPPIDLSAPALPDERLVVGGVRRPGIPTDGILTSTGLPGGGGVLGEREVERVPRVLGAAPEPRYPQALIGAGIGGRVLVQLVVDTLGRAEPGSVQVLDATREEFADAVRAVLPRFRFTAGEVAGMKVRTRVQIPFDFTIR